MRSAATPNRHRDQAAATWPGTCPDKPFGAGSSLVALPQPTHVEGLAQTPMHGTSLLHTFADPAAEEHHTQLTPERPGRTAPRESQGTAGAVLAGNTEVQVSADAGRDERLLRRTPAASYPDDLRLPSGSGPNRSTTPSKASSTWNDTAAGPPRASTPGLPSGCWPWPPASGTSGQSANSPSGR